MEEFWIKLGLVILSGMRYCKNTRRVPTAGMQGETMVSKGDPIVFLYFGACGLYRWKGLKFP